MRPDVVLDEGAGKRYRKCAQRRNKGFEHLPRADRPRCGRPALPGKLYCVKHRHNEPETRRIKKLPQVYRLLARSLQRRMDELEQTQAERLSLLKELDLVRISADEAIDRYGAAKDLKELAQAALETATGTPREAEVRAALEQAERVCLSAGEVMRSTLSEVKSFVIAAQQVHLAGKDQITPEMVRSVLNQCALLLYEVCGDEHEELAAQFEALVYDRISVAVEERCYVPPTLNIEHDRKRMMDSVPLVDEDALV